ncbi:MAG: hypothetical protein ACTTIZ_07000 [Treponema sp.]
MKAFVKVITSLVVFIFVFIFLFLFSTRHFSLIDSQYYQPSVVSSINSNLEKVVSDFEEWQEVLRQSFESFSEESVLKRCMSQNQTDGDIALREKVSAELMLSIPSMQGIRVVEKETQRIHFSTFSTDVISKSNSSISYAKYGKNIADISYNTIEASSSNNKPCVDILNNAFIFVQPFYDDYNVERGKVFFYVSAKSFGRKLINEKRLSLSEEITLLTDDNLNFIGILLGLPYENSVSLKEEVLKEWKVGESDLAQISSKESLSSPFWILVTVKKLPYYVGRICDKNMFIMPTYARYFLITVVSLAFFLISFLILNMRQDRFVIARKKIQKLHASIIVDILKNAENLNDEALQEKIEYKRHDANAEIRKALGKKISQKYENEINAILDQSWANIIQVIKGNISDEKLGHKNNDDEILKLLKEILQQGKGITRSKANFQKDVPLVKLEAEGIEELDDAVEPTEELEEVDSEDVKEVEAEDFEGLDEIEDLEEVDELEEVPLDESVKENEPTDEVEDLEEVEELEEIPLDESVKENEPTDEVEDLEEVEELEEIPLDESVKESEASEEIEELEEVEELETLEEVQDFEEVGVDDFISMEEEAPPPRPRFEEVDDYIEPDNELFHSQSEEAENRFRHINIGGLDFSYLDDKKDEETPSNVLEVRNAWVEDPVPDGSPIMGELEVIGDCEPSDVESLEEEEEIINKDGIYTISEFEKPEPSDMEFKILVDSVINEN